MVDVSYLDVTTSVSNVFGSIENQSTALSIISKTQTIEENLSTLGKSNDSYINLQMIFKEISKKSLENFDYLPMLKLFDDALKDFDSTKIRDKIWEFLLIEENWTWNLLNRIYYDRFRCNIDEVEDDVSTKICFSEQNALKKMFLLNKDVRESQIVVDWLQDIMKKNLEKTRDFLIGRYGKAWEHTRHNLKRKDVIMFHDKKLAEMDPDGPLRGSLNLTDMDKNEENEYLKCLYFYLRAGDIDRAREICESRGEFWRSLTLDGWIPFINPRVCTDMNDGIESNESDIIGNPNRELFLNMCNQMSNDNQLNQFERAIYGIFSGNLDVLLLIDNDYTNVLWAYLKVFINENIRMYLQQNVNNGPCLMSQSLFGDLSTIHQDFYDLIPSLYNHHNVSNNNQMMTMVAKSMDQIFEEAFSLMNYNIEDILLTKFTINNINNNRDKNVINKFYMAIFHIIQRCIIINDIGGMTEYIKMFLPQLVSTKNEINRQMLRFLTHILLFIYSIYDELDLDIYYNVLEAYIDSLMEIGYLDIITFYISRLSSDLQIKWFTRCLKDVIEPYERKKCVEDALDYELPIVEITCLVAKHIRIHGHQSKVAIRQFNNNENNNNTDNNTQTIFNTVITNEDKMFIDGLNWLTITLEQSPYLIRQINALTRHFLKLSKYEAAKMAIQLVSEQTWDYLVANENESNQPSWLKSVLYEFQCIREYIQCMDLYADWYNQYHRMRPKEPELKINAESSNLLSFQEKQNLKKQYDEEVSLSQQWQKSVEMYSNRFYEGTMEMWRNGKSGWLSNVNEDHDWSLEYDTENGMSGEPDILDNRISRITDSTKLRELCVPKIALILQKVLYLSNQHNKSFQLADMIANESLNLYRTFPQKEIRKLLLDIRQSSIKCLAEGKDSLGYELENNQ